MAAFPPIRACIFDLDGLLINSEDIYTEIYNKILHSYGKPSLQWTTKALQQSRGKIGHERLITSTHLPLTVSEFQSQVATHQSPFTTTHPLPGVLPLLQRLSTTITTTHLALASSTTLSFFRTKTSHLPSLTTHFPPHTCLFRDDADMQSKKGKPAGDIFLLALERINASLTDDVPGDGEGGRVRPDECLVFEDSIAGVAAGRAAGMRVCWVPHRGLRKVCRGMEKLVLAGKMEEVERRLLALEAERVSMGSKAVGSIGEGAEAVGSIGEGGAEGGGRVERIVSEDGWAEMIGSLEEFDYAEYGIRIRD